MCFYCFMGVHLYTFGWAMGFQTPIPLFVLSKWDPPSPDALRNPGLVDVAHRKRGGPRDAPGSSLGIIFMHSFF